MANRLCVCRFLSVPHVTLPALLPCCTCSEVLNLNNTCRLQLRRHQLLAWARTKRRQQGSNRAIKHRQAPHPALYLSSRQYFQFAHRHQMQGKMTRA